MLSRNSESRPIQDTRPRSPAGMSPASKFRPVSWTPASVTARSKRLSSASPGTEPANGHQNSTASKPAAFAAAGRSSSGSSVSRMEQFTEKVTVGSFWRRTGPGRDGLSTLPGILPGGQSHQSADADQQPGKGLVDRGHANGKAKGGANEHSYPQGLVRHSLRLARRHPIVGSWNKESWARPDGTSPSSG